MRIKRHTKFYLWFDGKKCANSTGQDSLANKPTFQYKILVVLHFNVGHDSQMKGIAIDLLISIYIIDGFNFNSNKILLRNSIYAHQTGKNITHFGK